MNITYLLVSFFLRCHRGVVGKGWNRWLTGWTLPWITFLYLTMSRASPISYKTFISSSVHPCQNLTLLVFLWSSTKFLQPSLHSNVKHLSLHRSKPSQPIFPSWFCGWWHDYYDVHLAICEVEFVKFQTFHQSIPPETWILHNQTRWTHSIFFTQSVCYDNHCNINPQDNVTYIQRGIKVLFILKNIGFSKNRYIEFIPNTAVSVLPIL